MKMTMVRLEAVASRLMPARVVPEGRAEAGARFKAWIASIPVSWRNAGQSLAPVQGFVLHPRKA